MVRIFFQQRKLLVGASAYLGWQGSTIAPEIRVRTMDHATLKRLRCSGFMVGQSAIDTLVDATCSKIGPQLRVDRLRVVLVKPQMEFFPLPRRESVYGAFDFLYGGIHAISSHAAGFCLIGTGPSVRRASAFA